jgi:hypothetical protein
MQVLRLRSAEMIARTRPLSEGNPYKEDVG